MSSSAVVSDERGVVASDARGDGAVSAAPGLVDLAGSDGGIGGGIGGGMGGGGGLTPDDLAELMSAFNDVTTKLRRSHDVLQREVARLNRELRTANEQVERSRRLAALGEMAAGIAHEVRNPLGAIRLNAEMLREDLSVIAGGEGGMDLVRRIIDATRGLDGVVCDVLHFARDVRVRPVLCEADELLESAWQEAWAAVGPMGSGVEVALRPGGVGVCCDHTLMHRALVNVMRNAIEAVCENAKRGNGGGGGEGGTGVRKVVEVRALRRVVRERRSGAAVEVVVLRVQDTGPGIAAGVRDRMFNPFFTTREHGTGLGLAIVHRIVDAHGGRVSVRNRKSGGAVVDLILPAVSAAAEGSDGDSDFVNGGGGSCGVGGADSVLTTSAAADDGRRVMEAV